MIVTDLSQIAKLYLQGPALLSNTRASFISGNPEIFETKTPVRNKTANIKPFAASRYRFHMDTGMFNGLTVYCNFSL